MASRGQDIPASPALSVSVLLSGNRMSDDINASPRKVYFDVRSFAVRVGAASFFPIISSFCVATQPAVCMNLQFALKECLHYISFFKKKTTKNPIRVGTDLLFTLDEDQTISGTM